MDLYPVIISQPAGPLVILADAPFSRASSTPSPAIWQMSSLGTSDFVPRFVFITVSLFCAFEASAPDNIGECNNNNNNNNKKYVLWNMVSAP